MIDHKPSDLKHLTDEQLVKDLKLCVVKERALLTEVLNLLKEMDQRKLYSSLGYKSLYEYACIELKYSTDQAYRRIQAMRLLNELPEISEKIDSGALNLSNISQAQRYFNEVKTINKTEKVQILNQIENKSVRDAEKEILKLNPEKPLPLELKQQVTPTKVNVNFVMSEELEKKLNDVKSLLGPKSVSLSLADLVEVMAELSLEKLKEKKFGKRTLQSTFIDQKNERQDTSLSSLKHDLLNSKMNRVLDHDAFKKTKNLDVQKKKKPDTSTEAQPRYISKPLKYRIWQRDGGQCTKCSSTYQLQFDHIKPVALGGETHLKNLRLLCFNCNQRSRLEAKL